MTLDLNAISERADRATKGPWHVEYFGDRGYPQRIGNDAAIIVADTHWGGGGLAPDAEFIAHAREDVPALLAALAAVEQDRDRLAERLAAAEIVCTIFGWTGYGEEGPREKATVQAYMDWANAYGAPSPNPEWKQRVRELAERRDGTREKTLAVIRAEHSGTEAGHA